MSTQIKTPDGQIGSREITFAQTLNEAMFEEMERDDRVFVMGEDVGAAGGVWKVTDGLLDRFGPERVRDTPISEAGFVGLGVGAAMTGMRPIVEVMFGDFAALAAEQIVNQAAKIHYMSGGKFTVPLVLRMSLGAGRRLAAQHSQSLQAWWSHIPGLKVVLPSHPVECKGLLKSAIRDDNPVIFLEDKMMHREKYIVADSEWQETIPLGKAGVKRTGSHVTVIATSSMVPVSLTAADTLAVEGIEVEVIDPRTLTPLDEETLIGSVKKTSRCVVVDEGYQRFGVTAEIASVVAEQAFYDLEAPVRRIGAMDVPVPFSPALEDATVPDVEKIARVVREIV